MLIECAFIKVSFVSKFQTYNIDKVAPVWFKLNLRQQIKTRDGIKHEVNIQEKTEFFGWYTANESILFRKHIKQKTREVAWCCVSMAKLSNPV